MKNDPDHGPVQEEFREQLAAIAATLDEMFNPPLPGLAGPGPKKVGFFMTCFYFGDEGRFNYISNAQKVDVKKMCRDIADRIEAREQIEAAGPTKGGKQ